MLQRVISVATLFSLLASCATNGPSVAVLEPCEANTFAVVDNFDGARRGRCIVLSDSHVRISILPENDGHINDSAWFAFKIIPKAAATATITMTYRGGHHRYDPKISHDGVHWRALEAYQVAVSRNGRQATITVSMDTDPFWIAGQELITPGLYEVWNQKMAAEGNVELSVLGNSMGDRPIRLLSTNSDADEVLLLAGRQHPPEVSGAIGFFAFYEALLADSELARQFRQRFSIIAVPLMNPDGVIGGNWRHNLGGTDLNRDWGPFKQPETQLIKGLLDKLDAGGKNIRVFLDFHSTKKNIFYTQNEDNPTSPPQFTRTWLENAKPRISRYDFGYEENPVDKVGVAKNYMYKRYGIPSSTYEVGDETDRDAIRQAAIIFAEELMLLMLENEY